MPPRRQRRRKTKKVQPKKKVTKKTKRKGNARGLDKLLLCDNALYDVIEERQATRAQIVKKIWDYIKRQKLQDRQNGRYIIPDRRLSRVMGKMGKRMHGFKMGRYIKKHARQI